MIFQKLIEKLIHGKNIIMTEMYIDARTVNIQILSLLYTNHALLQI